MLLFAKCIVCELFVMRVMLCNCLRLLSHGVIFNEENHGIFALVWVRLRIMHVIISV